MSDLQARAEDVILGATLRWAGDAADLADCREVAALTAAALAEAGLLADRDWGTRMIRHTERLQDERDAARAELAVVKAERDNCREKWRRAWRRAERVEAALGRVRALADETDARFHMDGDSFGGVVSTDDLRVLLGEDSSG